jgi:hypothetical protein
MTTSLDRYVADQNRILQAQRKKPLDLAEAADRELLRTALDYSMEMENVTQDGELGREEIARRLRFLYAASNQLDKLNDRLSKQKSAKSAADGNKQK